jgi:hypothetical protein
MNEKLFAPTLILILFSVVGLTVPTAGAGVLQQTALAQPVIDADILIQETRDEVEQEIEQEAEQEAEQDQEQEQENEQSADQSNAADVSQDESNEQANVIETGDNTASTTQVGDNDAVDNEVEAESEGGDSGDAEAEKDSEASSTGGESGNAEAELEQGVSNEAITIQDSSADNNILANENQFGDDIALIDQENIADQDALNVGVQDQDLTQTIDQIQEAANLNVDRDVQIGIQRPPPPPPEPEEPPTQPPGTPGEPGPPGPTPPEEEGVWCYVNDILVGGATFLVCFNTQSECDAAQAADPFAATECTERPEFPPGCVPDPVEFPRAACVA